MPPTVTDRMVWVDLETTGLDSQNDLVLEVGIVITDLNLEIIDDYQTPVWDTPQYDRLWAARKENFDHHYVVQMHESSGLIRACTSVGLPLDEAQKCASDFLDGHGVAGEPLCGSSVGFDRSFLTVWLPGVHDHFSYRNIDISSLKELCAAYRPDIYSGLEEATNQKKAHRVLDDLRDTIAEFRYYRDNFLKAVA